MDELNIEVGNAGSGVINPFKHYKKLLNKGVGGSKVLDGLEGAGVSIPEPDLTNGAIQNRLQFTETELNRIIKDYLGDQPELYEIAKRIKEESDTALRILRDEDEEELEKNENAVFGALETIVRLDGSRPSFMIQNGEVNRETSPLGTWAEILDASHNLLTDAISCIGRINIPWKAPGFMGTGFLIQENLILTNRHVLQVIAEEDADGEWHFLDETGIDFGHEFRAVLSQNPRTFKRVIYCGTDEIVLTGKVDHKKLDLALIELEPTTAANLPRKFLSVDKAPDWARTDDVIYTIGFPGRPPLGTYTPTLIEQLFQSTFGCKRLAPGLIMPGGENLQQWTLSHDATTLGGNSGSVVLVAGRETAAAGLHYGGQTALPRQNWGHILGQAITEKLSPSNVPSGDSEITTLLDLLKHHGVDLIDRVTD